MPKIAIVYDWNTDLRSGGPTGYLANLEMALAQTEQSEIEFITRGPAASGALSGAILGTPGNRDLVEFQEADTEVLKGRKQQEAQNLADFLAKPQEMTFSDTIRMKIERSNAAIFHVHTTLDCIKLHNLLTKAGRRHLVKIVLTSHCPESPAREWADVSFAQSHDPKSAEVVYTNYQFLDRLAFIFADAFVFPCEEAVEPYEATISSFRADQKHKPFYYLPTAAAELKRTKLEQPKAKFDLEGQFVLSYLGRHNAIKGYDFLKRAGTRLMETHRDVSFLIAGKDEPLPPLEHAQWVEHGWTTTPEDILAASDVFVLPNRATYFDLVLLEVLSAGRIVLAANNGGNRYFADRSKGIVLFDSLEDFIAKAEWIKGLKPAQRENMARENRKLYEAEFQIADFGHRYQDMMAQLAEDFTVSAPGRLAASDGPDVDISVIVPVYNVERYLPECLDSLIAQDHQSFEVIIVDDGSTDGSHAIIESYAKRISLQVIRQKNQGLSAARNTGLRYARGMFVCFIDSDDYLHPSYLTELHQSCLKDGTDIAICAITEFDEQRQTRVSTAYDEWKFFEERWQKGVHVTDGLITNLYPSAWNKLYRTSLFESLEYPRGLLYEDNPVFVALMLTQERISYVNRPLYWHRTDRATRISKLSSYRMLEVTMIISLIYSNVVRNRHADAACKITAAVMQRVFWERYWSTDDPKLDLALSSSFFYLAVLFEIDPEWARDFMDPRIELDFFEKRLEHLLENKEHNGTSLFVAMPEKLEVQDRSYPLSETTKLSSARVTLKKEDCSILLHPDANGITVGECSGLGVYGPAKYEFMFQLEHEKAPKISVRVVATQERCVSEKGLKSLDRVSDWGGVTTDWMSMKGLQRQIISVDVDDCGPCTTFYLQARTEEGTADFAWLHVRKIMASRRQTGLK